MNDGLPREATAEGSRRATHTEGGRGFDDKGQEYAEDGEERGAGDESIGPCVGVGGSKEAEQGDCRGGVASGAGVSATPPGAMGAASSGADRVEHCGQGPHFQGGFVEGGAVQEGPGEHPQADRSGQGNASGCFGGGVVWHGPAGHHDDPTDTLSGVAECKQVERAARKGHMEEEILGMHAHAHVGGSRLGFEFLSVLWYTGSGLCYGARTGCFGEVLVGIRNGLIW